jgi:hypothetical protein
VSTPARDDWVGIGVGLDVPEEPFVHPATTPEVAQIKKSSSQVLISRAIHRGRGTSCRVL